MLRSTACTNDLVRADVAEWAAPAFNTGARRRRRAARDQERRHAVHDVDQLREELGALLASWEYAFAMGHGCSIGGHPDHRAIRQRAADLRARISELTD
jgi:hypothetical protein